MKAIETRYLGPTNARGSRIVARDSDNNRVMVTYNHALNSEPNHACAAEMLVRKMEWRGTLIGGHTKKGMVWVFNDGESFTVP